MSMQIIRSSVSVAPRELDGARLSPTTVRLISVGVVGGLLVARLLADRRRTTSASVVEHA